VGDDDIFRKLIFEFRIAAVRQSLFVEPERFD
jgi:hypothetical protein